MTNSNGSIMNHPTKIAVAIVERQGEFLVGQRPPHATLAGLWEFPGGKVQAGESIAAAAERECGEETGLQIRVQYEMMVRNYRYDHDEVELHFFVCELLEPVVTPHKPFHWVVRDRLIHCEFPAANRDVIDHLVQRKADKN